MDTEKTEELNLQLQKWLNKAQQLVLIVPPLPIYVAIGVVLFTVILFLATHLLKQRLYDAILLTGLSGGGKTVLFHQLRDGSSHEGTVTSLEPNRGTFLLHSERSLVIKRKVNPVHIIDVPGHPRLQSKLDEFLPLAAGIVYVVDAVGFLPNIRTSSEYLYDILTKTAIVKREIPVLLLCNKVDKVTAHTKNFIERQLEKEIDKLHASRADLPSADVSIDFTIGVPGEAFTFSRCHNKIMVAESSGLTGEVTQLEQFIRECVNS